MRSPINRGFLGGHPHRGRHVPRRDFYVGNDSPTSAGGCSAPSSSGSCWPRSSAASPSTSPAPSTGPCRRSPRRPAPAPPPPCWPAPRPVWRARCAPSSPSPRRRRGALMGDGNIQFSLYLVALTGMGMLATTGVVVSEDTFGPVSDNAAGIAEMSGEFHGEPEQIMVSLDAVGNTTKAVTKGFAIGSAVIAAVALFACYIETIGDELGPERGNIAFREAGLTSARRWRGRSSAVDPDQRGRPEDLHRPADRRLDRLPVLRARHPGRRPHGRRGRAGGARASSPTGRSCPGRSSPTTAPSSTSAPRRRCGSSPPRRCSPCSPR